MDTITLIILYLAFAFIITLLIKKFTKYKTWMVISLIGTTKLTPFVDKLAKHKRFWEIIADIAFIIGFGLLAVDFFWARHLKKPKRIMVLAIAFVGLLIFNYIVLWPLLANNPLPVGKATAIPLYIISSIFGLSGFVLFGLVFQAYDIILKLLVGKAACPGVAPVIPGIDIPKAPKIPMEGWLVFLVIVLAHEISHGILIRTAKIKLKAIGIVLLGILPIGAYAQPDDKQFLKADKKTQIRVLSMGSMANFMVFVLAFLLFFFIAEPMFLSYSHNLSVQQTEQVFISKVNENTVVCGDSFPNSAYGVLKEGSVIKEVNGLPVKAISDIAKAKQTATDNTLNITVDVNGVIEKHSLKLNDLGQMGIEASAVENKAFTYPPEYSLIASLFIFLTLLWIFNLLVAIVNFIPMVPFDGGVIFSLVASEYLPSKKLKDLEKQKLITRIMFILILILFLINVVPMFLP